MTAQASLFDLPPKQVRRAFPRPTARTTDPRESKAAADSIAPANTLLIVAIRSTILAVGHAMTQHQIAEQVYKDYEGRWQKDSVRTACARASLVKVGTTTLNGRSYALWDVPV